MLTFWPGGREVEAEEAAEVQAEAVVEVRAGVVVECLIPHPVVHRR